MLCKTLKSSGSKCDMECSNAPSGINCTVEKISGPSLIRIAWDQHLFRLVISEIYEWRDNLFLFNVHKKNSYCWYVQK